MMAEGCYRPEAAAEMWARMDALEAARGEHTPEILTTHPSHQNREAKIREWLPQAYEKRAASDCGNIMGFGMCFHPPFPHKTVFEEGRNAVTGLRYANTAVADQFAQVFEDFRRW